ncbi:MAG: hypothetical protein K2I47_05330, partial [Odoribacter sp.]|nr:hypothetical protein [Odoribacter sp.]
LGIIWISMLAACRIVLAAEGGFRDSVISVPVHRDSLRIIREPVLSVPVVFLPDSLIRDTLRYEFTKIKNMASKSALMKELYKLIFVNPKYNRVNVMRTQNSEERFKDFSGERIRSIHIKVLPPYGTSVYDTTYSEQDLGWLRVVANKIHMRTAEWTLRKQLTIKPGDRLIPFELVQNEIMLRRLAYIEDVSVQVSPVAGMTGEVDITIICKDDFSWGMEVSSNFINSVRIGVQNKNFMKIGHLLDYEISYRGTKDRKWGNIFRYQVNSILGTHFDLMLYYQDDYNAKQMRGTVERQFLTSNVKWAGGLMLSRVFRSDDLPDIDLKHQEYPFNYFAQDVWLGRSFLLGNKYQYTRNMYVTGRFLNTVFNDRPAVSVDSNQFYYNRHSYFLAFTYQKLKYYKANLIYDFGRTEDIPAGLSSAFTMGYENNDFENASYWGYQLRYSHFDRYTERYYAVDAAVSSYLYRGTFQRGLVKVGLHHISNLISLWHYRFRFYNDVSYVTGFRRYPDDYVYFRDEDILGFDSDSLRGNQKLSVSLSTTFFFPYIYKGFRMSFTNFVDFGTIVPKETSLFKGRMFWGLGLAVNLRNDNIVFKNISLRFSFYPNPPEDMRSFEASMSGNLQNGFYDYQVGKPAIVVYE